MKNTAFFRNEYCEDLEILDFRDLGRDGIFNSSSVDWSDMIISKRAMPSAKCTSDKCHSLNPGQEQDGMTRSVPLSTVNCPHCNHALIWSSK